MGSTRNIGVILKKTIKRNKFTPPSPIKATPSESASDSNIVSDQQIVSDQDITRPATLSKPVIFCNPTIIGNPTNFSKPAIVHDSANTSNPVTPSNRAIHRGSATKSNPARFSDSAMLSHPLLNDAGDVIVMSPSQSKGIHKNYSTPTAFEGSTTAVIAVVMRGYPRDGHTRHRSNKHCKQIIVRVLLDSGSNGDLIFVNKDKPMLLPYSKRLVPQSWKLQMGTS